MRMNDRVRQIIEMNTTNFYIPLAIQDGHNNIYPMYFGMLMGERQIVFPATDASGIDGALKESKPVAMMVADRAEGYEAYMLEGHARYVNNDESYDLVAEMQNVASGFPIHGAVVFDVESVQLVPPP
jgi:hypothetical protein